MTQAVDHRIGWDKLPLPLAMLVLVGIRNRLRARNLYDSGRGPLDRPAGDVDESRHLTARTLDGTYNDLEELMTLTAQGKVRLHTSTYPLDAINDAMGDLDGGRLQGRGILVPEAAV